MNKQVELIWEFRGPAAKQTAQHHLIHLREFATAENIPVNIMEALEASPNFYQAIWVVDQQHVNDLRERLKPHRGRYRQ